MQIEEANSIVYDVKSSCISSFIVPVAFALPERLLALQCPELSALHPPKRRLERPLAPREPPRPRRPARKRTTKSKNTATSSRAKLLAAALEQADGGVGRQCHTPKIRILECD
jgi:hypothetical protein